jgi:uncharacterized membrane protein
MLAIFTFLSVGVGLFFLSGPLLALRSLQRQKILEERLTTLTGRLAKLERHGNFREQKPVSGQNASPTFPLHEAPQPWEVSAPSPDHPGSPTDAASQPQQIVASSPAPSDARTDHAAPLPPDPVPLEGPVPALNWEQWIGTRGAAAVGAAVLGLAGIVLFRYAINQELIGPVARLALAVLTGFIALLAAHRLAQPRYAITAAALRAAGLVILYASVWAAYRLYALLPLVACIALLSAVIAVGGLLAVRQGSRLIAALMLLGGFCIPLLIARESASPWALLAFLLLLNLGTAAVARALWPPLHAVSLGLSACYAAYLVLSGNASLPMSLLPLTLFMVLLDGLACAMAWVPAAEGPPGLNPPNDHAPVQMPVAAAIVSAAVLLAWADKQPQSPQSNVGWVVPFYLACLSVAATFCAAHLGCRGRLRGPATAAIARAAVAFVCASLLLHSLLFEAATTSMQVHAVLGCCALAGLGLAHVLSSGRATDYAALVASSSGSLYLLTSYLSHITHTDRAIVLACLGVLSLALTALPLLTQAFAVPAMPRSVWLSAAGGAVVLYWPLSHVLFAAGWGAFRSELALLMAAAVGGLTLILRGRWLAPTPAQRSACSWLTAAATALFSLAIALQDIYCAEAAAMALTGAALAYLSRHDSEPYLRRLAFILLAVSAYHLCINAEASLLPKTLVSLVQLTGVYGFGCACQWFAAYTAWRHPTSVENTLGRDAPTAKLVWSLTGLAVIFAWINQSVDLTYAIYLPLDGAPGSLATRALARSAAWGLLAGTTLALGMVYRKVELRRVGLVLFTLTLIKVFLVDLSSLQDLYRVLSLACLAVSLLLVSISYQRFVGRLARER